MKKSASFPWTGTAGLAVGVLLIGWLFSQLDLKRSADLISSIGVSSVTILLPFFALHLLETLAWIKVFPRSIAFISFLPLLKIQVITETVSMTLPAGVAVGEPLRPFLCNRFMGIPVPPAVASVALRKLLLGLAQGIYTIIGSLLGFSLLQTLSPELLGFSGLGYMMVASGVVIFLLFYGLLVLLLDGKAAQSLHAFLMRVPFERLRSWLLEMESGFHETDAELKSYEGLRIGMLLPVLLLYLMAWSTLAIESFIILQLLGVDISFYQVLTLDIALTMLRTLFFFIPSGLGVQDIGYLACFKVIGVSDPVVVGGAFVLLRRLKELCWYAVGYLVMFLSGVHLRDVDGVQSEPS